MHLRAALILFTTAGATLSLAGGIPDGPATLEDLHALGHDPNAAATCGQCHTEIYDEWKDRKHASAWVDPIYQAAIAEVERPHLCHNCHIPAQVLDRLGRKPRTRSTHQDEGVTCVSCHKQGDEIHGPYGAKTDAHPVVKNEAFSVEGSISLCASCHATKIADVLPVAKDFLRANMQEKGLSCIKCHMPEVDRHNAISLATGKPTGEKRPGRSHHLLGPGDPEFCAKAFGITAERNGESVVVKISNEAGHGVPGLVNMRKFPMRFSLVDDAGKELASAELEISSDNMLNAEETRQIDLPVKDGAAAVRVVVDHVFLGEKVATVIDRKLDLQ